MINSLKDFSGPAMIEFIKHRNGNKYSLATGQIILDKTSTKKYFPLVNYGIIKTGNILKISN